ncbi:MAG TPA: ABC transporter substrate-binding protein [Actinomycetota bacterium]|nr:ABC transporter substrate-binding protein [Actinomycetota bacterium]
MGRTRSSETARTGGAPGRLARRTAWRRPSVRSSLVALTAFALLAAACTGAATPENEGGDTAAPGGSADVKNPGVFVHALGGEPETLDPAQSSDGGYGNRAIIQVYDFLVDLPIDSAEPEPMLATEVPTQENGLVSEDGLVYTFPIREGVTFHDGTDLTADDVKYSWDRVMTMNLPEGQAPILSDIIEETRVVDDFTFEVTLQQPAAYFLTTVAYSPPAAIVSQDAVEANGGVAEGEPNEYMTTNMVGTGPYRFVSWERNERLTFERFEDYWGEPAFLDARWEVVPDNSAIVLGMRAGDYDLVEPTPQYVAELESDEGVCFDDTGFLLEPLHLSFNLNIDPAALPNSDTIPPDFFWDKRVRQAFNLAFDYDAMVNAGLAGFGAKATYLPPDVLGYDPDAPKYEQDLAEAERLFRESGWWDRGFEVSILVEENNPTFSPVGLILKDSLEALNDRFRVNVVEVAETQFDEAHAQTPMPYAMWIKNADPFLDPHYFMETYFHPDGEWGSRQGYRDGYENPDQIADLIDRAAVSTDIEERERLYQEVLPLLYEDPMWIWAADEVNLQIFQCWVEDFSYNPLWVMPRWKFYTKG